MSDRIFIKGLALHAYHGVMAHEAKVGQTFTIDRVITGELRGHALRVVSPEDFVLLKVLSTRDRDLEDARAVIDALGDELDRGLVAREAGLLAAEIPDHDVSGRFAKLKL